MPNNHPNPTEVGDRPQDDVPDNPFAFSPAQLSKPINPKSIEILTSLGGLSGLEKGLRTDRLAGLSIDETHVTGNIIPPDARVHTETEPHTALAGKPRPLEREETRLIAFHVIPQHERDKHFIDRKRVFGENRLPEHKSKSFLQLAWIALQDRVLILLSIAAAVSLALGLYQTFSGHRAHESNGHGGARVEWVEGLAIIVAILIVVLVCAVNDWQKEKQFRELNRKKQDRLVKVVRSGRPGKLSVYDVLVGDVMLLEQGDILPVDGLLIEGHNISCDEASATGESDIVRKTPARKHLKPESDPFLLSGTKVLEGVGTFLVTAVGPNSSHGRTMMALRDDPGMTPLQAKLNIMAGYIAKLGSAAGLLLFTVLFIEFLARLRYNDGNPEEKAQQFLRILVTAITIIVVAVPEGLPLAVTLSLAFATKRMTKENNLVRHLQSCETMGNATVICSDKTGTLTENVMTVVAGTFGAGHVQFDDRPNAANITHDTTTPDAADENLLKAERLTSIALSLSFDTQFTDLVRESIAVNTTAFEGEEKGQQMFTGTKTETALLDWARRAFALGPLATERANRGPIIHLFPFNSQQKCMGVVIRLHGFPSENSNKKSHTKYRLLVKGAPEIVLENSTNVISDATSQGESLQSTSLEPHQKDTLVKAVSRYASQSLRTLALAYRDFDHWPPRPATPSTKKSNDNNDQDDDDDDQDDNNRPAIQFNNVLSNLTWLAVVAIQDPVRRGVPEAVATCHRASVSVKMVTGDNMETARAIALECGILPPSSSPETNPHIILEGTTFRHLPPAEMASAASTLRVLARSSPEDKRLLVKILRENLGQIVAVTGDGTNDAPALKAADVGFSMGITGTEVAKEASDIILMDDNFTSIVKALAWGRAINDSVKKFLQFQLTVNITAVTLTFISAVASGDEKSVLNAIQLLWVNLIMDTFAALALATDPPTDSVLLRPPDPKRTAGSLVTLTMWKMIIGQSIYQLAVGLTLHFAGPGSFLKNDPVTEQRTLVFNVFVFMQIFKLANSRRIDNRLNIFEGLSRNRLFMVMMGIMILGQVLIVEFGSEAFDVVSLNGVQWGISIFLGVLSIPIGVVIRLVPDEVVRVFYVKAVLLPFRLVKDGVGWCFSWFPWKGGRGSSHGNNEENAPVTRISTGRDLAPSSIEEVRSLQEALSTVRDDLTFLKRVRGGRIHALGETLMAHTSPRGSNISRHMSTSSTRSRPMQSAMGMPGLLAASIGGLGLPRECTSKSQEGH